MTPEAEHLGATFRRLRKELDMTLDEAAQACGVSKNTVASWEYKYRQFNTREASVLIRKSIQTLKRRLKYRQREQ
jgi:transcriptional regulator with XRE-family HTH domain